MSWQRNRNRGLLLSVLGAAILFLGKAQRIPDLPNFFSGYVETIVRVGDRAPTIRLVREFYDLTSNLSRVDLASQALNLSSSPEGEIISVVRDFRLKVQYQINRRYHNCSEGPLQTLQSTTHLDLSGSVHALESNLLFYLVNVSEYDYVGNVMYEDRLVLDSWVYVGNFTYNGVAFINATVKLSITKDGYSIPTISSIDSGSVLWRTSIDGVSAFDGSYENVSILTKFYDLAFEKPESGVFDVSYCASPADSVLLKLAVPVVESVGVDYDEYRTSLRSAVVEYTQLYPTQVGQIEVVNNGTDLLTTVSLSNISRAANTTTRKTAVSAYEMIVENSADGSLPFMVEVSGKASALPRILVAVDGNQNCSYLILSSSVVSSLPTQSPSLSPSQTFSPMTSCPVISCSSVISTTTVTATATVSLSSPCPVPIVPSPPVATPTTSPMSMSSSSCTPCQLSSSPSPTISPTACPLPQGDVGSGYTRSSVIGLSFGMLFLGVFITLASLFVGILLYNHCILRNTDRDRQGYHKHIDSKPSNAYFQ